MNATRSRLPGAPRPWRLRRGLALLLGLSMTGCYHATVTSNAGNSDPGIVPEAGRRTATSWSLFWGLVETSAVNVNEPGDAGQPSCANDAPPSRVTATTNMGFILLSTVSLGAVVPTRIDWDCAVAQRDPNID